MGAKSERTWMQCQHKKLFERRGLSCGDLTRTGSGLYLSQGCKVGYREMEDPRIQAVDHWSYKTDSPDTRIIETEGEKDA